MIVPIGLRSTSFIMQSGYFRVGMPIALKGLGFAIMRERCTVAGFFRMKVGTLMLLNLLFRAERRSDEV
jgi:hypothetical protein